MKNYSRQRWMGNVYTIGGRDTDISQIAYSMEAKLKERFGMNQVPEEIIIKHNKLLLTLQSGEQQIQDFLELVATSLIENE